jgi:hypothetical protein
VDVDVDVVAVTVLVISAQHVTKTVTTYHYSPVGLAPVQTANCGGVHSFRAGAKSGHRTRTHVTRTIQFRDFLKLSLSDSRLESDSSAPSTL